MGIVAWWANGLAISNTFSGVKKQPQQPIEKTAITHITIGNIFLGGTLRVQAVRHFAIATVLRTRPCGAVATILAA